MAAILSICKASLGVAPNVKDYYFQGSSSYAGLEAETGISIVKPEDWHDQEPLISVGSLILAAKVDRKTVRYLTANTKLRKSVTLLFAKDKIAAAEDPASSIIGKDYKVKGVSKGKILYIGNSRTRKNKY